MTKSRLKPCPFCGGTDLRIWDGKLLLFVECRAIGCDARGPTVIRESYKRPASQAVRLWNRRAKNDTPCD